MVNLEGMMGVNTGEGERERGMSIFLNGGLYASCNLAQGRMEEGAIITGRTL